MFLSRSGGSALHARSMNSESEINSKLEIDTLQKLLDKKTQELENAHKEIAALVSFILKSKKLSVSAHVNAQQTPDGQDVILNSKY